MKWQEILGNLTDYVNSSLEVVEVEGRKYRTDPSLDPSAIITASFGETCGLDSYNRITAQALIDARKVFGKERNLDAFVEGEIGQWLDDFGEKDYTSVGYTEEESGMVYSGASTDQITRKIYESYIKENYDAERVLSIAHPAHIFRVLEVGEVIGLGKNPFFPNEVTWLSNDPQPWVRGPGYWRPREIATRIHHKIKGLI